MFIRRTTIKSRASGEPYYTYRLVESVRSGAGVRQHTVLNLGRKFEVPRPQWAPLAQRIEALLGGQLDLIADGLDAQWEAMAQQYAARIVSRRGTVVAGDDAPAPEGDYQRVDLARVEVIRPRSVGAEHVALAALRRLGLDRKLVELGFNRHQLSAAIGTIVGRMVQPGSELATHQWLQQRSGLGELLDYDFGALDLSRLYRVSDRLLAHRAALEAHLYQQERDLFSLTETITLYDLTNTFFEGTASGNPQAKRGHSKEKRTDCPLVTWPWCWMPAAFPSAARSSPATSASPRPWRRCWGTSRWPRRRGPDGGTRCRHCHRGEPRLAHGAGLPLSGRQPGAPPAIRSRGRRPDSRGRRHPDSCPARGR
jgi:hypothetical protein